ncbi:MAG: hypothetical protein ACK56F_06995, partial [bacterium]
HTYQRERPRVSKVAYQEVSRQAVPFGKPSFSGKRIEKSGDCERFHQSFGGVEAVSHRLSATPAIGAPLGSQRRAECLRDLGAPSQVKLGVGLADGSTL